MNDVQADLNHPKRPSKRMTSVNIAAAKQAKKSVQQRDIVRLLQDQTIDKLKILWPCIFWFEPNCWFKQFGYNVLRLHRGYSEQEASLLPNVRTKRLFRCERMSNGSSLQALGQQFEDVLPLITVATNHSQCPNQSPRLSSASSGGFWWCVSELEDSESCSALLLALLSWQVTLANEMFRFMDSRPLMPGSSYYHGRVITHENEGNLLSAIQCTLFHGDMCASNRQALGPGCWTLQVMRPENVSIWKRMHC